MEIDGWIIFGAIVSVIWLAGWAWSLKEERDSLETKNSNLNSDNYRLNQENDEWHRKSDSLDFREQSFKQLLQERTKNFPLIGEVWSNLMETIENERARRLETKKHPAFKAADEVRQIKSEKRELIKELTTWKYKAKNYESVYPWLAEELAQEIEDDANADIYFSVYTQQEREDPVTNYVSPDDYRKLSVTDRNQLALDRYWQRGKKTKWMIGKMYERYVGYLYEKNGWKVTYFGIHKRFEDLGRDLIAEKGNEVHVIQCKNWSQFKRIYENHIFQLFGTTYSSRKDYPNKIVTPVFYTSTSLSDVAREFARLLKMEIHENEKFKQYPAIKCNVSASGEKIYHLPFDQQYDNTIVTQKTGEFYTTTVREAEQAGFRRAFRWTGNKA